MHSKIIGSTRAWFGLPVSQQRRRSLRCFPTAIPCNEQPLYDLITRVYNAIAAFLGILLLSPLLLLIALAVKLSSKGPALYTGARVGKDEKIFHIYKFRSMYLGSELKIGKRLVKQDENHYTPIGKFLRKFRLDELAQLFNVLQGDMNLVGPRPVRPIFLADHKAHIPGYARRFSVRPGITGQAQVRGGYYTSPRHKLFYEMLYIAHRSVLLDIKLIFLTFLRVMTRIFTTAVLLAWLLGMAVILPENLQAHFSIELFNHHLNALYLVPSLIVLLHLLRKDVVRERIYAFKTPVDLPLLGFLIVSALLIPLSRFPETALRGLLWYICNGAVVFYLVLNSRMVSDRRSILIHALTATVSVVALFSLLEVLYFMGSEGIFRRLAGSYGSPLIMATILVLSLPLALSRYRQSLGRLRWIYLGMSFLLLIAALLTLSRSGILALALALSLYFWRVNQRQVVWILGGFLLLLTSLTALGDQRMQPESALRDLRAAVTGEALLLEKLSPKRLLVGVGARTMPLHLTTAKRLGKLRGAVKPQNSYLSLFIDHGPLGLLFFLAFLGGGLLFMFRTAPQIKDPQAQEDLWATASGLLGFAFLILFSDALYEFPVMLLFWSAMGLGVGLALRYRGGPKEQFRLLHYRHKL